MYINIKLLSKNQNSLKKFLVFFKNLIRKKQKKENLYKIKKKSTNKSKKFLQILTKLRTYKYKSVCKYKIKKRKHLTKKNINGLLSYLQKKRKHKIFTILKSPHINKIAQEQIEYRLFSKQINIISFQILKFLVLIKKLQVNINTDIKIQIIFILNDKITTKTKLIFLNPDNYKIKHFFLQRKRDIIYKYAAQQIKQKPNKRLTLFYLKLFDIYGELSAGF